MEERNQFVHPDDVVDLGNYFSVFRKVWWKAVLLSLAVGLGTLIVIFQLPNMYQATAVITPPIDEKKLNPALGALAAFGVTVGGPSNVEDLESLFKSNDLTARVFRNHTPWPIVFGDRFDTKTGTVRPTWFDRLSGREEGPKQPGYWDAVRAARDSLKVATNRKTGVITISFESRSAEGSANIIKYYLQEGKSRLQEEALDRATKNKKFIEEQIGKTVDTLNRDRLYSLLSQEVEREMMARNREQFGFRVIDFPQEPDRKSRPRRAMITILVTIISMFIFSILMFFIERKRKSVLVEVS